MADVLFGSNVDLSDNELRNVVLQVLATDPDPLEAKVYYNSSSRVIRFHNGTSWVSLESGEAPLRYAETIGDGVAADFTLTHNLNTRDVVVSVREAASPYAQVVVPSEALTVNTVKVYFATPPTEDQYRVTVVA